MRRAVRANSSRASALARPWVTFMMANMSALPVSAVVSADSPTGMPAASSSAVRGRPYPMSSSLNGEMLTVAPAAARCPISAAVAQLACTTWTSGPSRSSRASASIWPAACGGPQAWMVTGRPSSRAVSNSGW